MQERALLMGLSSEIPSDDLQAKPRRVIVLSSRHRLPGQTTKPEWQGQGGEIRMLRSDNFLSIAGWSTRCWARIDRSCSASSRRWPNDPPHLRRPVGGARLRAAARRSRAQPRFAVGRPAQGIPECRLELPSGVCRRRRSQGSPGRTRPVQLEACHRPVVEPSRALLFASCGSGLPEHDLLLQTARGGCA